jgi:hypothetical protein
MPAYTVWDHDEDEGRTLVLGEGPPTWADGTTPMHVTNRLVYRFEAEDWDAAVREFDRWRAGEAE